jgi:hypothetical protein
MNGEITLNLPATERLNDWSERLAKRTPRFTTSLDTLVATGCDRMRLLALLETLDAAQVGVRLSKKEAETIRGHFIMAAKAANHLASSDVGRLMFPSTTTSLEFQLDAIATTLKVLAKYLHKNRSMHADVVKALLVRYVERMTNTKRRHDKEVAVLVDAVLRGDNDFLSHSRGYSVTAHGQWRRRQRRLIAGNLVSVIERQWEGTAARSRRQE